jgi:hypothetical protein
VLVRLVSVHFAKSIFHAYDVVVFAFWVNSAGQFLCFSKHFLLIFLKFVCFWMVFVVVNFFVLIVCGVVVGFKIFWCWCQKWGFGSEKVVQK